MALIHLSIHLKNFFTRMLSQRCWKGHLYSGSTLPWLTRKNHPQKTSIPDGWAQGKHPESKKFDQFCPQKEWEMDRPHLWRLVKTKKELPETPPSLRPEGFKYRYLEVDSLQRYHIINLPHLNQLRVSPSDIPMGASKKSSIRTSGDKAKL